MHACGALPHIGKSRHCAHHAFALVQCEAILKIIIVVDLAIICGARRKLEVPATDLLQFTTFSESLNLQLASSLQDCVEGEWTLMLLDQVSRFSCSQIIEIIALLSIRRQIHVCTA